MKIGSIVMRCYEFDRMLAFWQEALHYVPREPAEGGWVILCDPGGRGPNASLEKVPEPFEPIGKTTRVHLDLYTNDQEGEMVRLVEIGATRYPRRYSQDEDSIVLEDPDGNRFCVVQVTNENRTILRTNLTVADARVTEERTQGDPMGDAGATLGATGGTEGGEACHTMRF